MNGLPTSIVQRQVSTQTVLLLLSLLHLGVMMVMVLVVVRMVGMQRRRLSLHQSLTMKSERSESLTGQIHGRRAGMVLGGRGRGCGVVQTHLRLGQVGRQVVMRVMRMMRMMTRSDTHQTR